jgi:hypothetical protein
MKESAPLGNEDEGITEARKEIGEHYCDSDRTRNSAKLGEEYATRAHRQDTQCNAIPAIWKQGFLGKNH